MELVSMRTQKLKGKKVPKGLALVIVLAIMICLSIIAGAILIVARGHYHATGSQIKHTKAFYLAEAGVQWALWRCRTAADPTAGSPFTHTDIEDPPDSGYHPPITISITAPQAGDPSGTIYHIESSVDPGQVRIK